MENSITAMRPISVGNQEVQRTRVGTYKLLGLIISDDLKWNTHVECVIAKAAKRLYALRLLKRAGVIPEDMLKVYTYNIRSVLEYAAQVWQDIRHGVNISGGQGTTVCLSAGKEEPIYRKIF